MVHSCSMTPVGAEPGRADPVPSMAWVLRSDRMPLWGAAAFLVWPWSGRVPGWRWSQHARQGIRGDLGELKQAVDSLPSRLEPVGRLAALAAGCQHVDSVGEGHRRRRSGWHRPVMVSPAGELQAYSGSSWSLSASLTLHDYMACLHAFIPRRAVVKGGLTNPARIGGCDVYTQAFLQTRIRFLVHTEALLASQSCGTTGWKNQFVHIKHLRLQERTCTSVFGANCSTMQRSPLP